LALKVRMLGGDVYIFRRRYEGDYESNAAHPVMPIQYSSTRSENVFKSIRQACRRLINGLLLRFDQTNLEEVRTRF